MLFDEGNRIEPPEYHPEHVVVCLQADGERILSEVEGGEVGEVFVDFDL